MKNKSVCIFGLGYIGLPTAALLADAGFSVTGIDINQNIIKTINNCETHIVEPGLNEVLISAIKKKNLIAQFETVVSDIYMICVPTPLIQEAGVNNPDLRYVENAAKEISKFIKTGDLVILESTSPVGTTKMIEDILLQSGLNKSEFFIAYCPERVLPGNAIKELITNDRIVGGRSNKSAKMAADFYRLFVTGEIYETNAETAEMCKLAENSFRDVNLAFANELSMLSDKNGVDIWKLIELANKHPRVNILQPGTGVGGHCIAVDPWFLISKNTENSQLMKVARQVNHKKVDWVVKQIIKNTDASKLNSKITIACLGLTFKADIDDMRGSPALEVYNKLRELGYNLMCIEPNIDNVPNNATLEEITTNADVIAVLVKHKEFLEKDVLFKLNKIETLDFCGALS
jgi:UDP-N-acetyl-D-mannosaminuronic acid dehydrogenase